MAVFTDLQTLPSFHKPVLTIGTFDGVHLGHARILEEVVRHAREAGGESMLITFEPHPRKLLFPDQPLHLLSPLRDKIELVLASGIDHVVVAPFTKDFSELDAESYIRDFLVARFRPYGIIIGYDHRFGRDRSGNIAMLHQLSGQYDYRVFEIPAQMIDDATVSSTKIRKALDEGKVEEAAHMLGRPYCLGGTVVSGAQLGRTIGFPTANVAPADPEQLVPARGVYAVWAEVNGERHAAMMNIGFRPTVTQEIKLHLEAHLLDWSGDLYEQELRLHFVARLRDEQKFPSLDALKEQLGKDREAAGRILLS